MMSEQPQLQRMQQTMPEDGGGWRHVNAGPHLHIMFHPNRQLLGREPDDIERPSIVVAVAGKREQPLRFDPFSMAVIITSARACVAGRFRFGSRRGRSRSTSPWRFSKSRCGSADSSHRPKKTVWRRSWMTPTWLVPPGRSGNFTPPSATYPPLDGREQAGAGTA
jgi:hypothetical protein